MADPEAREAPRVPEDPGTIEVPAAITVQGVLRAREVPVVRDVLAGPAGAVGIAGVTETVESLRVAEDIIDRIINDLMCFRSITDANMRSSPQANL